MNPSAICATKKPISPTRQLQGWMGLACSLNVYAPDKGQRLPLMVWNTRRLTGIRQRWRENMIPPGWFGQGCGRGNDLKLPAGATWGFLAHPNLATIAGNFSLMAIAASPALGKNTIRRVWWKPQAM